MQFRKTWLAAALFAFGSTSHAATPTIEELQKQIKALQQAVDALQQQHR